MKVQQAQAFQPRSKTNRSLTEIKTDAPKDAVVDSVVLSKALTPQGQSWVEMAGLAFTKRDKKSVVHVLKGQTPEQLKALARQYKLQTGRELQADLADNFKGADLVEVSAYARHGRMDEVDSLRHAILDGQSKHALRILNQKTEKELEVMRRSYHAQYGGRMDQDLRAEVEDFRSGRLEILLKGEPDRRTNESEEAFAKRQGEHVAILLKEATTPKSIAMIDLVEQDDVLGTLHGRSPAVLRAAESAFESKTGRKLKSTIEDVLGGTREDIALNYRDDGRETSMEKLRRAFDGNNDEELIRRTLRDLNSDERKKLIAEHGREIRSLFTQLDDEELPEMEALLQKGQVGDVDRLRIAIADGSDKKIVRALCTLSDEGRKEVKADVLLRATMYGELDSEEHKLAGGLLEGRRMSSGEILAHAESSEDFYQAAAAAKTDAEREAVRLQVFATRPDGINVDRLDAHLRNGELTPQQRIMVGEEKEVLKELRGLTEEELKKFRWDNKVREKIFDELDGPEQKEAINLLYRGPLPAHESVNYAVAQDDGKRALEVIKGLKSDEEKRAFLRAYKEKYESEPRAGLDKVLSGMEMREAENALRLTPRTAGQVSDRVRGDMLADRDDNDFGSAFSNGVTDLFSDAGFNMDDQAREVELKARRIRRGQSKDLEGLVSQEASFQDSRRAKALATKKIADIAVPVLTGLVTGGLGTVAAGAGAIGYLALGGASISTRFGLEKAFRGNDFGTVKDYETAAIEQTIDTVATITGAGVGARFLNHGKRTSSVVKEVVGTATTEIGNAVVKGQSINPTKVLTNSFFSGTGTGLMFNMAEAKSFWKARIGDLLEEGIGELPNVDQVL
ncbi:MAG: hypothetical protein KC800_15395 [Candidatus Eremiobacteraeota bacterium]|nr:hypothetical protein [Candidatus Eremiobacteraeota bacterium]